MKNAMIILAIGLLSLTSVSAQPQGRGYRAVNLDEIPGITTAQKEQVEKIRTAQQEEMQKLRGENRGKRGQLNETELAAERKKVEELRAKTDKEIEGVFNAEQLAVYKEKRDAARQQQMRPGEGRRGGPQAGVQQGQGGRQHYARGGKKAPRRGNRNAPCVCPCASPAPVAPAQEG